MEVVRTSFFNLLFRFIKFFNGNFLGARLINQRILFMGVEVFVLGVLSILAFLRKKYLWLFGLIWTFTAIIPYAMIISSDVIQLQIPILETGVAADRYLYYSAAGAAFLLVMSFLWINDERKILIPNFEPGNWFMPLAVILILALTGLNFNRTLQHEAEWDKAGQIGISIGDDILLQVPDSDPGSNFCVGNLPDNYHGKYIFRNGIENFMYLKYDRNDFEILSKVIISPDNIKEISFGEADCSYIYYYDSEKLISYLEDYSSSWLNLNEN